MRYVDVNHHGKTITFRYHGKGEFIIAGMMLLIFFVQAELLTGRKDFIDGMVCLLVVFLYLGQIISYKRENTIIEVVEDMIEMAKKQNKEGGEE